VKVLHDLSLASPWALLALLPVLLAGAYLAWRRARRMDPALRFPSLALVEDLPDSAVLRVAWLPDALRLLSLSLLALALARPQLVGPPEADEAEGIDIVLALDISCSMQAADFQPNDRIFVAKKSVNEFVLKRKNDRVGLVVFAGEAASWVPLTLDYSLLGTMLDEVEVGLLQDGTAIGNAIGTALNRLRESEAKSKVVVLITDGDSNAGEISPNKAAELAKDLGVKIYTVLIGKGGEVPFPAGKDLFGRLVYRQQRVDTNPKLLQEIAATTGGEAFVASDKKELDDRLSTILDRLDRSKIEATLESHPYAELFPWAVLVALLSMALELLLRSTRFQRFP
jgi:Ca-activated chloride channel family protein